MDRKTDRLDNRKGTEMRHVKEKKQITDRWTKFQTDKQERYRRKDRGTDRWRKFQKDGRKDKGTEMMEGSKKKKDVTDR